MIGGLFKSASRVAIVAAAGVLAGGVAAQAADLGGNCCADLEERVAELEATAARKGNRKVSLTVYGQVNEAILWHDDELGYREGKATIRDDDASPTRFGFRGEASIRPDLTAGYVMEFGITGDNGTGGDDVLSLRHNYGYLDSKTFGRVSLGHTSQVTDGLYEINLANTVTTPGNLNEEDKVLSAGLTDPWNYGFDGGRKQGVYYRTPTLAGFVLSAGYSHDSDTATPGDTDDYWEAALRYAGEFNGVRLAAGVGYRKVEDNTGGVRGDQDVWLGSGSVMHMPTGLFVSGGLAKVEWDSGDEQDGFWVTAGIERNWFGPGATTLFGEYSEVNSDVNGDGNFWGLGVVQKIDAAATDLYLKYRNVEADDEDDDANVVIGGMRIQF